MGANIIAQVLIYLIVLIVLAESGVLYPVGVKHQPESLLQTPEVIYYWPQVSASANRWHKEERQEDPVTAELRGTTQPAIVPGFQNSKKVAMIHEFQSTIKPKIVQELQSTIKPAIVHEERDTSQKQYSYRNVGVKQGKNLNRNNNQKELDRKILFNAANYFSTDSDDNANSNLTTDQLNDDYTYTNNDQLGSPSTSYEQSSRYLGDINDGEEESSYLSYDKSQLDIIANEPIDRRILYYNNKYNPSHPSNYLNSIVRLAAGNSNLKVKNLQKAVHNQDINPVVPAANFIKVKDEFSSEIVPPKQKVLIVSDLDKGKQNKILNDFNRQTRASFQKPSEFLRLNPTQRTQISNNAISNTNKLQSSSTHKIINLPKSKMITFDVPKIISFQDGSKRYKYTYVSTSPNVLTHNLTNINKQENLFREEENWIKGPHSIPTREDAIYRLNHARSQRKEKLSKELKSKDANKKSFSNPPPISISLLKKAIIVSKRDKSEYNDNAIKTNNAKADSNNISPEKKASTSISNNIHVSNLNSSPSFSVYQSPAIYTDQINKKFQLQRRPKLTSDFVQSDFIKEVNEESIKSVGKNTAVVTNLRNENTFSPRTDAWIPSTHLLGKLLSQSQPTTTHNNFPNTEPLRQLPKAVTIIDPIQVTTEKGFLVTPNTESIKPTQPVKILNSKPQSNLNFPRFENKYPSIPLAIQKFLLTVNQPSPPGSHNQQQFIGNFNSILKKSLKLEEPIKGTGRRLSILGSPNSRSTAPNLPPYPTKEMIHDPQMLIQRRKQAEISLRKSNNENKKIGIHNDLLNSTTNRNLYSDRLSSIADQISLYEKVGSTEKKTLNYSNLKFILIDKDLIKDVASLEKNGITYLPLKNNTKGKMLQNPNEPEPVATNSYLKNPSNGHALLLGTDYVSPKPSPIIKKSSTINNPPALSPFTSNPMFQTTSHSESDQMFQTTRVQNVADIFKRVSAAANEKVYAAARASIKHL